MLRTSRADFDDDALPRFLQAHLDDLAPTAPAESRHALDLSALKRPTVRLWVAREGGVPVGTFMTLSVVTVRASPAPASPATR